ncbi:CPBP family intramembrane metalloprotease [Methanobacterium petrolearium]|uniref:CPBP family intramembrane glutamic endopeptidase n=1 Tax=Methanobacterium petrolearium TaxID=710190 RepID=UPI0030819E9C
MIINPTSVEWSFNPAFFILLILSLIIYPIQASFEEIFFRGYLMQGIGLLTRKPAIPLLITSVIFAIGHFWNGNDVISGVGMVINMFIFGITLGIITLGKTALKLP